MLKKFPDSYRCSSKVCRECEVDKDIKHFYKAYRNKDGLRSYCKQCDIAKVRTYQAKNQEKVKNWQRDYDRRHSTKRNEAKLKHLYGITQEDFDRLAESQNYRCLICKNEKKLVVDHCHETSIVRDLLCNQCNLGIGSLKEDIECLKAAIIYLKGGRDES